MRQFTVCDSNFDHFLFVWKREKVRKDLVFPKNNFYCISLNTEYYTVARRYEFYVRVARTIALATRTQNSYLRANA